MSNEQPDGKRQIPARIVGTDPYTLMTQSKVQLLIEIDRSDLAWLTDRNHRLLEGHRIGLTLEDPQPTIDTVRFKTKRLDRPYQLSAKALDLLGEISKTRGSGKFSPIAYPFGPTELPLADPYRADNQEKVWLIGGPLLDALDSVEKDSVGCQRSGVEYEDTGTRNLEDGLRIFRFKRYVYEQRRDIDGACAELAARRPIADPFSKDWSNPPPEVALEKIVQGVDLGMEMARKLGIPDAAESGPPAAVPAAASEDSWLRRKPLF